MSPGITAFPPGVCTFSCFVKSVVQIMDVTGEKENRYFLP